MASIKTLAIGDRRQGIWNNYLVDQVGAELRVAKIDLIFTIPARCCSGWIASSSSISALVR